MCTRKWVAETWDITSVPQLCINEKFVKCNALMILGGGEKQDFPVSPWKK